MTPSPLERRFWLVWRACHGPELATEHRFHTTRRWRFDFAHIASKTAFEVQGGAWVQGRHSRGAGMTNDAEKAIEAAQLGWLVLPVTRQLITVPTVEKLVALCKARWILQRGQE